MARDQDGFHVKSAQFPEAYRVAGRRVRTMLTDARQKGEGPDAGALAHADATSEWSPLPRRSIQT